MVRVGREGPFAWAGLWIVSCAVHWDRRRRWRPVFSVAWDFGVVVVVVRSFNVGPRYRIRASVLR